MKTIYVLTGGTMVHITPHFSICAPAYGTAGEAICGQLRSGFASSDAFQAYQVHLVKTRMAGVSDETTRAHLRAMGILTTPETNDDLRILISALLNSADTVALVVSAAICDFEPVEMIVSGSGDSESTTITRFGKDQPRLHHAQAVTLNLRPSEKIIDSIKAARPELILVTFKTTTGLSVEELYAQAFHNLRRSASDFVYGNDLHNQTNLVVTQDGTYHVGSDRTEALNILCTRLCTRLLALSRGS